MTSEMTPSRDLQRLIAIMAALRTPDTGCPWDLEQNFATIAPYTIEEAYEVADAIARGDLDDLSDELGDLLLQVVFHARMAEEQGAFAFGDVVEAITEKLIRRHPHVFGDDGRLDARRGQGPVGRIKAEEKAERRAGEAATTKTARSSTACQSALPALTRALQASAKGFRASASTGTIRRAVLRQDPRGSGRNRGRAGRRRQRTQPRTKIGDLLFAVVNLARHVDVDPEAALRGTNAKFERRFASIERCFVAAWQAPAGSATLAEMDALWDEAKAPRGIPPNAVASTQETGIAPAKRAADLTRPWPDRRARSQRPCHRHGLVRVEHFGIAMQPVTARAVGAVERPDRASIRVAASRSSIAASSASSPSPVSAETRTGWRSGRDARQPMFSSRRAPCSVKRYRSCSRPRSCGRGSPGSMPSCRSTSSTSCDWASVSSCEMSRTCRMTSASITSSSVARNAATSMVGRSEMKPTVSDRMTARAVRQDRPRAGSDRASRTACRPPARSARVMRLNSVDLPALV